MRYTKVVSVWPVGLLQSSVFENPIVVNGKVVGFDSNWKKKRDFAVDMAGFAISVEYFLKFPHVRFNLKAKPGFLETDILVDLNVTINDLEPKAKNCTQVIML